MEDKKLLELAAKAAGLHAKVASNSGIGLKVHGNCNWWNPLTDDGDALRLAVKLCIDVSHDAIGMKSFAYARTVFNDEIHIGLSEIFDDESERHERVRRAITRAAAQIGKEMK